MPIGTGTTRPPLLAVKGHTLLAGEPGAGPASIKVYDVSADLATLRGEIPADTSLRDLAVAHYGDMALSAPAGSDRFDAWDTTANARTRAYERPGEQGAPAAVAAGPDDDYVVGGWNTGDAAELVVYDQGTSEVIYSAVLRVTGPKTGVVGERLEFSGTFAADGITFPRTIVTIVRHVSNSDGTTTQPVAKAAPAADGTFGFADTPTAAGKHTYAVQLVGNSSIEPAKTSRVVLVSQPPA
ncbi:hypothetical protein AB0K12_12915 [Nonomuraea sp. NPDC049419]|uniref:hypothetical protein n=1 Tax=Nonomuraea sp. NPDC049419 TaxID=3155772 RepID=UPI003420ABD3